MIARERLRSDAVTVLNTGDLEQIDDDVRLSCVEEVIFEFDEKTVRRQVWRQYGKGHSYHSDKFVQTMCEAIGVQYGVRVSKRAVHSIFMDGRVHVSKSDNALNIHFRLTRTQLRKHNCYPMPKRSSKGFPEWAVEGVVRSIATKASLNKASNRLINTTKMLPSKEMTPHQRVKLTLTRARRSRQANLATTKKMSKTFLITCLKLLRPLMNKPLQTCLPKTQFDKFKQRAYHDTKGAVGWLIEELLGIPHGSLLLDMGDGEIKTTTVDNMGHVLDRIPITTAGIISEVFDTTPPVAFEDTKVFLKLSRMLLVGIYKPNKRDCGTWEIRLAEILDFTQDEKLLSFLMELNHDYHNACNELLDFAKNGEKLHGTGRGKKPLLQTCQKDKGGNQNTPMCSERYGEVSPVTYAWAFTRSGMNRILDSIRQ